MDELVKDGNAWCFAKPGEVYVIYFPYGGETSIDLSDLEGSASLSWFNPRQEAEEIELPRAILGRNVVKIGPPPSEQNKDWVVILRK